MVDQMNSVESHRPVIYVGPDKCGSTWLYRSMIDIRGISPAFSKDVSFFDSYFHRGVEWYESQFNESDDWKLDVSHDYLFHPACPVRIRTLYPDATIVFGVRDPIDRAISAFRYMKFQGRLASKDTFDAAISKLPEILGHGCYSSHLPRWLTEFSPEKVIPLDFRLISTDPMRALKPVLDALDLTIGSEHKLPGRVNGSRSNSRPMVELVKIGRAAHRKLKDQGYENRASAFKGLGLALSERLQPRQRTIPSAHVDEALIQMFEPDYLFLRTNFGIDLCRTSLVPPFSSTEDI